MVSGATLAASKHVAVTGILCREQTNGHAVTVLRLIPGKIVQYD